MQFKMTEEHHRHGRLRLHRQQLRALRREQPPERPRHRPGQADLRRQPREHRRGRSSDCVELVVGGHLRRRAARTGWSPATTRSCTTPPRATTTTPSPTRSPSCAPTSRAPSACWRPSGRRYPLPSRLHRRGSTATWRSTTPPSSPRRRRITRAARTRAPRHHPHARARLDPHLRPSHHDLQLLLETTARPARGEVHPQADHQHHRRRPPQALRPRRERPRLDPHRGPLLGRLGHPHQGSHGDVTIGANGEKDNITVLRMILEAMGKDPEDFDWVADRPGHDRRDAIDSTKLQRELGWRPAYIRLRRGPEGHHRLVRRERVLVAPSQGGHRGPLQGTGAVVALKVSWF